MARVLELVELTGLENRAPNQLSGGQQQRVALARALVMEPKVLLMDEPLSNLDAKLREQMRTEIRRIQQRLGITSVYVTHDQVEAMTLSDQIVVMNQGKIEQVGTPDEIYRRPRTRFVADFIGRANFVEATVRDRRDGHLRARRAGHDADRVDPCGRFRARRGGHPGHPAGDGRDGFAAGAGGGHRAPRRPTWATSSSTTSRSAGNCWRWSSATRGVSTLHPEGQAVKVRFLEDCLYVLPK